MSAATLPTITKIKKTVYPDSDGKRMADNTLQFEWIVTLKENLDILFRNDANVFVAGDLLWYPVKDDIKTRMAPDAMVAFGRPKGYRGSYIQFQEEDIAPQVVFEVLSPGNRRAEMERKFHFYERFGVEEYYILDPYRKRRGPFKFESYRRDAFGLLQPISLIHNYVSPRLGISFDTSGSELIVYRPDNRRFLTMTELGALQEQTEREREQAKREQTQAERERERAEQGRVQAEGERDAERAAREKLAARLRELGVDPDSI